MRLSQALKLHEPFEVFGGGLFLLGDALLVYGDIDNRLFYFLALFGACSQLSENNEDVNRSIRAGWKKRAEFLRDDTLREMMRLNEENRLYARQQNGPVERNLQKVIRYLARQRELCDDLNRYFDIPELIALYMYISGINSFSGDEFVQIAKMGKLELCTEIEQTLSNIINRQTNPLPYHNKQEEQESPMKRLKK